MQRSLTARVAKENIALTKKGILLETLGTIARGGEVLVVKLNGLVLTRSLVYALIVSLQDLFNTIQNVNKVNC